MGWCFSKVVVCCLLCAVSISHCARFPISGKDRWDGLECDSEDSRIQGHIQPRAPPTQLQASQQYPAVRNLRDKTFLHISSRDLIANWTEDTCEPRIADVLYKLPTHNLNLVTSFSNDEWTPEECREDFGGFLGFIDRFRPALAQAGFRQAIVTVFQKKSADAMRVKNELAMNLPIIKIPAEIEDFAEKLTSFGDSEPHIYMMLLVSPWPSGENNTLDFVLENCTFHIGRIQVIPSGTGSFPRTWVPVIAVLFLAIPLAGFCYCLYRCIKHHYLKEEEDGETQGIPKTSRQRRAETQKFLDNTAQDNYEL